MSSCRTSFSTLLSSFKGNTHVVYSPPYTHTHVQGIQFMDYISFFHSVSYTNDSGLLSVVCLCNGHYRPVGLRITEQSQVHRRGSGELIVSNCLLIIFSFYLVISTYGYREYDRDKNLFSLTCQSIKYAVIVALSYIS